MRENTGVACNYVLYAILSGEQYCICNNVRRTVLHHRVRPALLHNAIVSARTHVHMQLCPPPCKTVPCSKLNALGRRNTFAIFLKAKCMSWMTWEMFGRWVFAAIITWMFTRCIYVGSVHARSLTRAHTCTVMYMSAGRFLHSPGQYCMTDTVVSYIVLQLFCDQLMASLR